jgi:hypothetical protein
VARVEAVTTKVITLLLTFTPRYSSSIFARLHGFIKVSLNLTSQYHCTIITHIKSSNHMLDLHRLISSSLLLACPSRASAATATRICHSYLYSRGTDMHLHVIAIQQSIGSSVGSTENTASSIVPCWTVFTELLSGNTLIKPVTIFTSRNVKQAGGHPASTGIYLHSLYIIGA